MIGGEAATVSMLDPIWRTLAPGIGAAPRTPGRDGPPQPGEEGYLYCGPAGAGHFVKMIHNGIEYGLMAAYAEGLAVLERANLGGSLSAGQCSRIAPLQEPDRYQFDLDLAAVAELWRRGSVITSWLLDLTAAALRSDPDLSSLCRTCIRLRGGSVDGPERGRSRGTGPGDRLGPLAAVSRRVTRATSPIGPSAPCVINLVVTPKLPLADDEGRRARPVRGHG